MFSFLIIFIFMYYYRQDAAKRQTAARLLNLLTGQKSGFPPQGRLVAPIHVKFGTAEGHEGSVVTVKFHANRCPCGNAAPKWQEFPLFVRVAI